MWSRGELDSGRSLEGGRGLSRSARASGAEGRLAGLEHGSGLGHLEHLAPARVTALFERGDSLSLLYVLLTNAGGKTGSPTTPTRRCTLRYQGERQKLTLGKRGMERGTDK